MSKIFISIASYRDPELIPTLKNLVSHASLPENLHIAVSWQHNENEALFQQAGMKLLKKSKLEDFVLLDYLLGKAQIKIIDIPHYRSQGACWARNMAEKCYDNENYFLQIDSHCRFIKAWDSEMIAILTGLKDQSAKPVLSHYPAGYKPENEEERFKNQHNKRIVFLKFNDKDIPVTCPTFYSSDKPQRSSYIAGGFIFAEGSFVKDVPNDPEIFFMGEEIMMSARAFTHGYDIYTPHKILLWHYYVRKTAKIWQDHDKEAKENGKIDMIWWERNRISNKRLRHFFGIESSQDCQLGIYAPGNIRSLKDFEYTCGISFKKRAVQPEVIGKARANWFPVPPVNEDEWEKKLVSPYLKKITIEKSKLDFTPEEIERWHLTILDAYNHLIEEIIFSRDELQKKLQSAAEDSVTFELKFNTYPCFTPQTIRMTPYFNDARWGEAVELKW